MSIDQGRVLLLLEVIEKTVQHPKLQAIQSMAQLELEHINANAQIDLDKYLKDQADKAVKVEAERQAKMKADTDKEVALQKQAEQARSAPLPPPPRTFIPPVVTEPVDGRV